MISHRCFWIAGLALIALLGVPRPAAAGLMDIIFEMSGPRMVGVPIQCKVTQRAGPPECYIAGFPVSGSRSDARFWFSFDGGLYRSTAAKTNNDYDRWDVGMVAFEPMVEVQLFPRNDSRFSVYHGAGPTLDLLFGDRFRRFGKLGAKVRPIAFEYRWTLVALHFAYNLRLYKDQFTSADFGFEPRVEAERPFEAVHGIMAGVRFRRF